MHCSCGGWSAGWIVRWRCSHIQTHTGDWDVSSHAHTSRQRVRMWRFRTVSHSGLWRKGRREGRRAGVSLNSLGLNDFITSQLHTSQTFSFQTSFHANSKRHTCERVRVFGCGRRHPERDCWCKTLLFVAWGGVCLVPPGGQGENRSVTNITKSVCSSNSWFWYTDCLCYFNETLMWSDKLGIDVIFLYANWF